MFHLWFNYIFLLHPSEPNVSCFAEGKLFALNNVITPIFLIPEILKSIVVRGITAESSLSSPAVAQRYLAENDNPCSCWSRR